MDKIEFISLGLTPYLAMRQTQSMAVKKRIANSCGDLVYFCEHPPCITFGKRATIVENDPRIANWKKRGIDVFSVDRGGKITFHGPGQLLIYPVINLKSAQLGLKSFVSRTLAHVRDCLAIDGAYVELERPGVWVKDTTQVAYKLASVGLNIERGVTNHGFSVNISLDTEIFHEFEVCGVADALVTSQQLWSGNRATTQHFAERFAQTYAGALAAG